MTCDVQWDFPVEVRIEFDFTLDLIDFGANGSTHKLPMRVGDKVRYAMGTKTKTETGVRREQTIVKTLMDRAIEI
jgi:hypothetical protein